tara:strand:- start:15010 stop:15588 length:579 start_codon:yes stop_codon:yes gene_type:complete
MVYNYGSISIAEVLNIWNDLGVFSYVLPFLLIFSVVFAILEKTELLGKNRTIAAIISSSIGLLALQFDYVPEFFSIVFPRFGVALSLFLVTVILIGFFHHEQGKDKFNKFLAPIGWVTGIGVVIWSLSEYDQWLSYGGFGGWFEDNIWTIIILGVIIAVIVIVASTDEKGKWKGSNKGRDDDDRWDRHRERD